MFDEPVNHEPGLGALGLGDIVPDFDAVTTLGPLKLQNLRDG